MAIGAGRSRSDARTLGRISGAELRAMGVNQDYSPDADVNVNPANPVIGVRSFGADPDAVAALVAAEVKGLPGAGVAATAKHFPGHGDTAVDSHYGFPVITHSRALWEELDAVPFPAAIAAGIDSIMTAHIQFPALDDSGDPATLSRPILTGILREELGYDGVVITDSLGMQGCARSTATTGCRCWRCGPAWTSCSTPVARCRLARGAEGRAGRGADRGPAGRIDPAHSAAEGPPRPVRPPWASHARVDRTVGTKAHLATADRIAERTTTLLVNEDGTLPFDRRAQRRLLVVGADPASPSGTTGPPTGVLAAALTDLGFTATALPTGTAPSAATIDKAVTAAREADAVVVATYNVTRVQHPAHPGGPSAGHGAAGGGAGAPQPVRRRARPVRPGLLVLVLLDGRRAARRRAGHRRPGDTAGKLPVPVQRADDPKQVLYPIGHGLTY